MIPSRRDTLRAGLAAALFPGKAFAVAHDFAEYRDAIVIDGNLVMSMLNDEAVVGEKARKVIVQSGLTAAKQTLGGSGASRADTLADIDGMDASIARNSLVFRQVASVADVRAAKRAGKVGILYSFEAASMHEGKVDNIDLFHKRGVKVMGLSYNDGSPFGTGTLSSADRGLTALGVKAVERMNDLGITVDLSHSDEPTSFNALAASLTSAVITHAGCAAVHVNPRNKSDALLRAVAAKGGVVGVFDLSYIGNYPRNPTLSIYMDHLVHALNVCGEEHVGMGSDVEFSGFAATAKNVAAWTEGEARRRAAGIFVPEEGPPPYVIGLNGPERWSVIADQLRRRGYGARATERVLGLNWMRVFSDTWHS
jgi:membrane dipeptidase